jgi:hypothetical protein
MGHGKTGILRGYGRSFTKPFSRAFMAMNHVCYLPFPGLLAGEARQKMYLLHNPRSMGSSDIAYTM